MERRNSGLRCSHYISLSVVIMKPLKNLVYHILRPIFVSGTPINYEEVASHLAMPNGGKYCVLKFGVGCEIPLC